MIKGNNSRGHSLEVNGEILHPQEFEEPRESRSWAWAGLIAVLLSTALMLSLIGGALWRR